ncbi:MAG TPA: carboxymuconolactone decarboxylase family protein [Balneolales bacterium]|nr:carboxymuconolactone decarboxylase family protein [Balneolales bacterium]
MNTNNKSMYPPATPTMSEKRANLAPDQVEAFRNFSNTVFKAGAIDEKTKQLIAVAVAHVTQCPYCIKGHTKRAKQKGATNNEIMEAIWVASEMRAGAAYAHAALAIDEMEIVDEKQVES